MPSCVVPGCKSGYGGKNSEKKHFFSIPKNLDKQILWKSAIKRDDKFVTNKAYVCEEHFMPDDIIWHRKLLAPDGRELGVSPLKIPRLKPDVIPSRFSWNEANEKSSTEESSEASNSHGHRKDPEQQTTLLTPNTKQITLQLDNPEDGSFSSNQDSTNAEHGCDNHAIVDDSENRIESFTLSQLLTTDFDLPFGWIKQSAMCEGYKLAIYMKHLTFKTDKVTQTIVWKAITVKEDMSIEVSILGEPLDLESFDFPNVATSAEQIRELLSSVHKHKVCSGCAGSSVHFEMDRLQCRNVKKDIAGTWRRDACSLLVLNSSICRLCQNTKKNLGDRLRKWKQGKTKNLRGPLREEEKPEKRALSRMKSRYRSTAYAKKEAQRRIKKLRIELGESRSQAARYSSHDLEKQLEAGNITKNQAEALKQIIEAAKRKNSKGRRYSEEWMLLCMLLHMRSPSGYEFLRTNEILPLPAMYTIRKYLSRINTSCGFDPNFFKLLKLAFSQKEELKKHGVLLLDEISTRESVAVNTTHLTIKGLIDFGADGEQSSDLTEKANHGLVLMFQPFNDTYSQPIAVFASRGPVKGDVLARLIVKAIILLERSGAKIHGVVSDGAAPNRKFWSEMGVNTSKNKLRNYFDHPVDETRKIYVFSDTPHLIKTIRNRLYNNGERGGGLKMHPAEQMIDWKFIKMLYDKDKELAGPGQALVCPKLSINHVVLNNSLKMRVRLAVQVFSNSVAGGLRFFENFVPEFKGCEATASFCKWMNDMFDALNRTQALDGVQPGSHDFKVIKESLAKLDAWEDQVLEGKLPKELFLTPQTAEGLRVSLKSMLDLIEYTTQHCGFSYVLTGRVNQDPLEKFFGTVRQAGGSNDHPSTPTFLSIYKILSLYSVLKPPKMGNCSVTSSQSTTPLVTLSDLKSIYSNSERAPSLAKIIRKKLDRFVENDDWQFENVTEEDCSTPEVTNCAIYCLTADLVKRILLTVKCLACKDALIKPEASVITLPEAVLSNWQQRDGLIHPNAHLYKFVLFLEARFQEHCESSHIFDKIVDDVYNYPNLAFPCTEHAHEILAQLILRFITMRMHQFCTRLNAEQKKKNQHTKKSAKFYTS